MFEYICEYGLAFFRRLACFQWQTGLCLAPEGLMEQSVCPPWIYFAATEEKTEPATPHRKQESRKKGQVARSTDLNAAVVVLAIIVALHSLSGYVGENLAAYVRHILSGEMGTALSSEQFFNVFKLTLNLYLRIMAPIFVVAVIFGLLVNFMQVGMVVAFEGIKPKLSNINPIEGFKRIFSRKALFEFAKILLKVFVIGLVAYSVVSKAFDQILVLVDANLVSSLAFLNTLAFRVGVAATGTFLVIAVADLFYQKWKFNQSLKMSKYEIKKEIKQTEGDPLIKAKLREKQRMMSMRRMMQSIPEATVVVTNPTHLAVALKYDEDEMDAPQIVAKGAGYTAEKIKEKAAEHNIPIVEDKPLARSLYSSSEIGDFVPVELYQAVAGVIAAIYALKNKKNQ